MYTYCRYDTSNRTKATTVSIRQLENLKFYAFKAFNLYVNEGQTGAERDEIDGDVMLRYHVDQVTLVSVPSSYEQTLPFINNNMKSFRAMILLYW